MSAPYNLSNLVILTQLSHLVEQLEITFVEIKDRHYGPQESGASRKAIILNSEFWFVNNTEQVGELEP